MCPSLLLYLTQSDVSIALFTRSSDKLSKASRGFGDFANALDNTEEEKKGDESKGEEDDEPSGEDEEEIDVPPPLPTVAEALESLELSHLGDKLADSPTSSTTPTGCGGRASGTASPSRPGTRCTAATSA